MPAPTENSWLCSISTIAKGKVGDVKYRLLPVYSELLKPDAAMAELIGRLRAPHVADWSGEDRNA